MGVPSIRFTNLTLLSPEGLQTTDNARHAHMRACAHARTCTRSRARRFDFIPSTLVYASNELELQAVSEIAKVPPGW